SLKLCSKVVSDTNTIGFGIVNDIDSVDMQGLVQVVSTNRSLMIVGCGNTEVRDSTRGTQRWDQIVRAITSRISCILRKAGIGIGRTNLGKRNLVSNRHLCLSYVTIERTDNTNNEGIASQCCDVLRTDSRIMYTARADVVFRNELESDIRNGMIGVCLIDSQVCTILSGFTATCILTRYG